MTSITGAAMQVRERPGAKSVYTAGFQEYAATSCKLMTEKA
jgi:hypothetical protein